MLLSSEIQIPQTGPDLEDGVQPYPPSHGGSLQVPAAQF